MYQAISLLETLMKHSDIQEILDFFSSSSHAAVDLLFWWGFWSHLWLLAGEVSREEKAESSHERYQRCCQQALTVDW